MFFLQINGNVNNWYVTHAQKVNVWASVLGNAKTEPWFKGENLKGEMYLTFLEVRIDRVTTVEP